MNEEKTLPIDSGFVDEEGHRFLLGDKVDLFGIPGTIVFESGAFGVATKDIIDWDLIEKKQIEICGNAHHDFCYNDNFVSLWELAWNFDSLDGYLSVLKVTGNSCYRDDDGKKA